MLGMKTYPQEHIEVWRVRAGSGVAAYKRLAGAEGRKGAGVGALAASLAEIGSRYA